MTKLKGVFLEFVFTTLPSWCRCKLFPLGKYKYNYKMSQELHHFKPQNICGKVYIEKYGLNQLYFYMFLIGKKHYSFCLLSQCVQYYWKVMTCLCWCRAQGRLGLQGVMWMFMWQNWELTWVTVLNVSHGQRNILPFLKLLHNFESEITNA